MLSKLFFLITIFLFIGNPSGKGNMYHKEFYPTGYTKSEGWIKTDKKVGYWKFYHSNGSISMKGHYQNDRPEKYWYFYHKNGNLEKEGHYNNGKKRDWWLFYDEKGKVNHKCQLSNGRKNGYCLKYTHEKLTSAEKYANGKKIMEWFSLRSFKKENNLSDLR